MDAGGIILVLIGIGFLIWVVFQISKGQHASTEDSFAQAGVEVSFTDKTIQIKGKKYPISAIRGLRSEKISHHNRVDSYAYIEIDDFNTPVNKITFRGPELAETFISRLELAIKKANQS